MLVLSRKLNESIVIGDNIRIKVVGISGSQIRLGIEAPGDIKVMRQELLERDECLTDLPHSTQFRKSSRRPLAVSHVS